MPVTSTALPAFDLPHLRLLDAVLLDVACALVIHAVYKRYEINALHLFANFLLLVFAPALPALFFVEHFESVFVARLSSFALFYSALATSIVVYRLSPWHPLAQYPGPVLAKISKLWAAWMMAKGTNHIYHKQLHDRYGPYVRTGPNELSIADASAIPDILGVNGMTKGPMWSARFPPDDTPSLIAIRTTHEHVRRRKPWNRAFNTAGVKGYEPLVVRRALQLVGELEKRKTGVDLASWFSFFAVDFMGDMAFGGGFELMHNGGDNEGVFTTLQASLESVAIVQHLSWLSHLLFKIPGVTKNVNSFREFSFEKARMRRKNGSLLKDLFFHLGDEDGVEKTRPTEAEILSNGELAIVAGSDTTSTTLGGIFYYLLTHPDDYNRLQKEVDAGFPPGEGDPFDATKLTEMPFLNAVINETLRLQPAVATYIQRAPEAGSGGKWVGDRFFPEGTAVIVPPYVLHRDPRYFHPSPDAFWPERWLRQNAAKRAGKQAIEIAMNSKSDDPGVIVNTVAFIPFSYGPEICAGRNLALTELRMVVSLIIQRFEVRFASGYDPREWETKLEDWFTMKNGRLPVVLTSRN
ncbi:high nitrogen upregulated cytochrome P450 monooxygenase 2 [Phellopilus nigrolimitatus]|nr:high nitrogen upregulated cytochrome P450 monooxygenase 2 [Phellopilus nigrolimitatus]